ncbi:MAG TPA: type II toxin-antitoxin system PemK/MazF family toxin [Patescibacteria group bacterium]|nr:type II toxin-antitoxin system PemK/MazF family toxin [Patescibacteria group bacterium]
MAFLKGDVVLVPFPFTDLSAAKTRPAVVVSTSSFERTTGNITVAMITFTQQVTPYDCTLVDWKKANLLFPSWVRAKLVTLSPALVRYHPGRLSRRDLSEVEKRVRHALGL